MVSTQVVEDRLDIHAAVLITEAAPWPSLAQRAGRCNRTSVVADARLRWLLPASPAPYDAVNVAATVAVTDQPR